MEGKSIYNIKNLNVSIVPSSLPSILAIASQSKDNSKTTSAKVPEIGELWPEQGGVLAGIMPAQEGTPAYYLIVPLEPEAEKKELAWGGHSEKSEATCSWDGKANTEKLAASNTDHPAAEFCASLNIGEHDDFYLPSRREASMIAATVPQVLESGWYWTSTQYSADNAFIQYFSDGYQNYYDKYDTLRVRAVRRFLINSSI